MRNNLGTILLLLFLCLFVTVGFLFYCYSDSRNSLQPHSSVVLHSAMASRPRKVKGRSDEIKSRRWKQVSQPIVATNNEALEMTNEDMSILEHRDKRIRTNRQIPTVIVNQPLSLDEHSSNNNTVVPEHVVNSNSLQFAESANIRGECSQSFGQALYQRTKQGSVVTYEDSGDNVYTLSEKSFELEEDEPRTILQFTGQRNIV